MKKILAIALSATMILSSFNVFAQDKSYEDVVSKVKNVLSIGEYDNFDCSQRSENGREYLNMNWSNKEGNDYVDVTCDINGNLYNYYTYTGDYSKTKVYTENECKITADNFLKKILGNNIDKIEYSDYYMSYDSYSYTYNIMSGDIPFSSEKINVNINKYTNDIISSNIPYYLFDTKTDNFAPSINEERAKEILKSKFYMVYITSYDYDNKKFDVIPAYAPEYYCMNAVTGEEFNNNLYFEYGVTEAASGAKAVADEEINNRLTEVEKTEIDNFKNIIKVEDAVNKLNSFFNLNISVSDINYNYYKNNIADKNYYNLGINYNKDNDISATFDQDGRLIYYNVYSDNTGIDPSKRNELLEKAENIIKANYPSLDFILRNVNNENSTFTFTVLRNGIKSIDESILIQFNSKNDFMYVDFGVNNYAEYTPVNSAVTKEEAFNKGIGEFPLVRSYYTDYHDNTTTDVYNINAAYAINALTGEIISIDNGKPLSKNNNKVNTYSDIKDQWYADYATNLLYMNYRFEGDLFEGEKPLTFKDLEEFLNRSEYVPKYSMNNPDNYKKYESEPDKALTRYEFAEIFTDIIGYEKITDLDIYKAPYEDTNKGSVAIMKGLGLLDYDNTFNGDEIITRAEMAKILYNYIITDN